jgi:hypothetical protein
MSGTSRILAIETTEIPPGETVVLSCILPWSGTTTGLEYVAYPETYCVEQITIGDRALLSSPVGPGPSIQKIAAGYAAQKTSAIGEARRELESMELLTCLVALATRDLEHLSRIPEDRESWVRDRASELAGPPPQFGCTQVRAGERLSVTVRNAGGNPMLLQIVLPVEIVEIIARNP